jgi:biotin synthase
MSCKLTEDEILSWLKEDDENRLEELWQAADDARCDVVGDEVHSRGLIEFCNICVRQCAYCGLRAGNERLSRYHMSKSEILDCVNTAREIGCRTIVLQSGECSEIAADEIGEIIEAIKAKGDPAVTLSLGEREPNEYRYWRNFGADRYLLKFETSDAVLYKRLHPPHHPRVANRIELLPMLRQLGYEVGSGIMVGLPGQTWLSLAQDIRMFADLDLDMVAIGPFIPHPDTPLGSAFLGGRSSAMNQVPNTELAARKAVALARLVSPEANIPATTALAVSDPNGYEKALGCGANVIMINVTPTRYRTLYEIYPNTTFTAGGIQQQKEVLGMLRKHKRRVGSGTGGRFHR